MGVIPSHNNAHGGIVMQGHRAITRRPVSIDSRVTSHREQEYISSRMRAALAIANAIYTDEDIRNMVSRVQSQYPEIDEQYIRRLFVTHSHGGVR